MKNKFKIYLLIFTVVGFTSLSLAQSLQPYLLKDINPGANDSNGMIIYYTAVANNKLIFTAKDDVFGPEVWVTDGTEAGTQMVKDIYPGPGPTSSWPMEGNKIIFNDNLYFHASDIQHGIELWVTDGTETGTFMLKDINPGTGITIVDKFIEFNGLLYFITTADTLWVTDGTEAGTHLIIEVGITGDFKEYNNKFYFGGFNGNNDFELWASDGTESGTQIVKDIYPGNIGSAPSGFIVYDEKLFFYANDGIYGRELWVTDGTEVGTFMFKDIYPGSNSSLEFHALNFIFNDKLYFVANNGSNGAELWFTDGTETGTQLLKDINTGSGNSEITEVKLFNDKFYFSAINNTNGRELWGSDGTAEGTVLVKDINPGGTSSNPRGFTEYNGQLYFVANNGTHGSELWRSDGTEMGTFMIKDINPGIENGLAHFDFNLIECDGKLYFAAKDIQFGYNLWETDGTEAGTIMLRPNNSTVYDPLIDTFDPVGIVFQDELYFMAMYDEATGIEPYKLTTQPLSIETPQLQNVSFYPNPTGSELFISTDLPVEKAVVYNLQGQMLISQDDQETRYQPIALDLSTLQSGIYFIKLTGNGWEETSKIIKK